MAQPYSFSRAFALATAVLFILACVLSGRPARADPQVAATVQFSFGAVTLVKPDGNRLSLSRAESLHEGDTLLTGEDGRVHLRFMDGGFVSLVPNSEFRIESWRYNGEPDGSERLEMRLLKGGLRTISGRIGKMSRSAYELATRVATIGIRGTEYTVLYLSDDSVTGTVAEGRIGVCNKGGCLDVPSGYSFLAIHPQTAPVLTDRAAELRGPFHKAKPKTANADTSTTPATKSKTADASADLPSAKRKPADADDPTQANKARSERESWLADQPADHHPKADKADKQKSPADAAASIDPARTVNLIDYDTQPAVPVYSLTPPADSLSSRVPEVTSTGEFSGSGLSLKGIKPVKK